MKLKEDQLLRNASEFETYKDVLDTPGWRILVEDPVRRETEWSENEIKRLAMENIRQNEDEIVRLQEYRKALIFVQNQIVMRTELGEISSRTLRKRAEQLGLAKPETYPVPKFQEVK